MEFAHTTVLLEESVKYLNCRPGKIYVDCTLGGGGHSQKILEAIGPTGKLIAIDQDEEAIYSAKKRLGEYQEQIIFVRDNFVNLSAILDDLGIAKVDGIMFDLGVSSYQLDNPERGFSYQHDAPLDMRMNNEGSITAADLVNNSSVEELAKIIWQYGEERWSKRIAQFIGESRIRKPLATTGELVEVIKAAIPAGARRNGPHPAKRTFQALRIAVNDELEVFRQAIRSGVMRLEEEGRLCVISFHSLEDRIAKHTFRELKQEKIVKVLTNKPILPSEDELENNPRARSAKLRALEKAAF